MQEMSTAPNLTSNILQPPESNIRGIRYATYNQVFSVGQLDPWRYPSPRLRGNLDTTIPTSIQSSETLAFFFFLPSELIQSGL